MRTSTQSLALASAFGNKEAVRLICEAGFDCVDHSLFGGKNGEMHIEEDGFLSDMDELRTYGESIGIFFNQTHAPFASFREGDADYNEWMKPLIIKAIEATAILGASYVVIHPFVVSGNQKQENMKFYESLIPFAERNNVIIAIENMFGYDPAADKLVKNVCSDGPGLADYIDTLDSKNICACLDIGHCGLVGESAPQMIRQLGGRLRSLHVHDNDNISDLHTMPFTGKIDFPEVIKALNEIGYKGELTLEADHFITNLPKELYIDGINMLAKTARYIADATGL